MNQHCIHLNSDFIILLHKSSFFLTEWHCLEKSSLFLAACLFLWEELILFLLSQSTNVSSSYIIFENKKIIVISSELPWTFSFAFFLSVIYQYHYCLGYGWSSVWSKRPQWVQTCRYAVKLVFKLLQCKLPSLHAWQLYKHSS